MITHRLAEDQGFRSRLMADPRGTLAAQFKIVLAPAVSLTVHEDRAQELHIVVPPTPNRSSGIAAVSDDRSPQNRAFQ